METVSSSRLFTNNEENEKEPIVFGSKITRLLSSLADFFILSVLGIFITIAPCYYGLGYYEEIGVVSSKQNELTEISLESHLTKRKSRNSYFSHEELVDYYIDVKISEKEVDDEGKRLDLLEYYYIDYTGHTVEQYNLSILKLDSEESLFEYREDKSLTGILKEEVKQGAKAYKQGKSTNKGMINKISAFFDGVYDEFAKDLGSSPKYAAIYEDFIASQRKTLQIGGISVLIGFACSALVLQIILPTFLLKGSTLGQKILKLYTGDQYTFPLPKWKLLLRGLLVSISSLPSVLLIGFVSSWGMNVLYLPVLSFGTISITMGYFSLPFIVLSVASYVVMFIRKDARALHDLSISGYVYTSDVAKIEAAKRKEKLARGEKI